MNMIQREILNEILPWLGRDKILILKGQRQVGKTTLLMQLKDILEEKTIKVYYFSADKELGNPIFEEVKYFIRYIEEQLLEDKLIYIFIDEFQYIKNAGIFMKVLFDNFKGKVQFIVSGSSSLEVTKNSEFLTGRKIEFFINHISFYEYIKYKSQNKYKKLNIGDISNLEYVKNIYGKDILDHFYDYINYGGYPEICVLKNHKEKNIILKEIVETYIKKDIIHFLNIENISAFNNLLKILASQVGNLINKNELSNTLNINYETTNRYLDILKGTYIFDYISPYFQNTRKEVSKMQKVFINDIGTSNYILGNEFKNGTIIPGALVENFVYNVLCEKYNKEDIYYYRTISKSEIDFIVKTEKGIIVIEVKYKNKAGGMPVAISNFEKNYPNVLKKILITKDELQNEGNNYKIPFHLLPFIDIN